MYSVVANPYQVINEYGAYQDNGYGVSLPDLPDKIMGMPTKDLKQYKALAEEFAPTVAKLIAGMSPPEQYAQLEARVKVLSRSPWLHVPLIGAFLQGRLAEYKNRLLALEDEVAHYDAMQRRYKWMATLGVVAVGTFVLVGATWTIKNIMQTVD
jgi:hypothetical protein